MDLILGTGEASAIIPEVWSGIYYDVLLAELPWQSLINNDYEGEIRALGDTVHISSFSEFEDAEDLPESAAGTADVPTISGQSLVINMRVAKDFIVTNQAMLQSLPMMEKLRVLAIYAILKKIQAHIIATVIPSSSAPDHTVAYGSGTTLALADILNAKELLDTADVPQAGRAAVMGAAQLNDIFNITGFTSSDFLLAGNQGRLTTGASPDMLAGFDIRYTTIAGNQSTWFHRSFMTSAFQKGLTMKGFDLGGQGIRAARVNMDTLFGLKQLDNKRVLQIG
jgi:hypothetical protein